MKISKFKNKKIKHHYLIISLSILGIGGIFLFDSFFGKYHVAQKSSIQEGEIQGVNAPIIAVNVDGNKVNDIPAKDAGKSFDHVDCTNGATGSWDQKNWRFLLSNFTKTKCTLYFVTSSTSSEQNGASKLEDLLEQNKNQARPTLKSDEYSNIRYIGPNPNNWVTFNDENWRIIGLMDGIQTKEHGTQRLLKIIRNNSLGAYSWDSSASNVNSGYGVNEWSQADIQKVLNENYFNQQSGGICYGSSNESTKDCPDWAQVGLKTESRNMVEEVTWNTGTSNGTESVWQNQNFAPQQYQWERSSYDGKQCTNDSYNYCTDNVQRYTTWTGKVGLMYLSDYGYATDGGGSIVRRGDCLYTRLYSWDDSSNSYCKNNDWIFDSISESWTMTPAPVSSMASQVLYFLMYGDSRSSTACDARAIRPVVYLKSSVKITGGTGEKSSPYQLKLG